MINKKAVIVLILFLIGLIWGCGKNEKSQSGNPQDQPEQTGKLVVPKPSDSLAVFTVDSFDETTGSFDKRYPEYVENQEGFDVYYVSASVQLTRIVRNSSNNKAIRIKFDLPPAFSWGNWLSLRKGFREPLNLEGYQGLDLDLKVEKASPEAFLRITLSDLSDDEKKGDEMWWFDADLNLLQKTSTQWKTIRMPFDKFRVSSGEGTRHNDYQLNLGKIAAYEINLVSNAVKHPKGVILIDSFRTYK